eukprot:4293991-Amphidinium_carterae.1
MLGASVTSCEAFKAASILSKFVHEGNPRVCGLAVRSGTKWRMAARCKTNESNNASIRVSNGGNLAADRLPALAWESAAHRTQLDGAWALEVPPRKLFDLRSSAWQRRSATESAVWQLQPCALCQERVEAAPPPQPNANTAA